MKICMVSNIYYPHPGGISEHIYHLTKNLKKREHEVKILTADYRDNKEYVHPDILRVGRSIPVPSNKSIGVVTIGRNLPGQVKEIFEREKFDIVHAQGSLVSLVLVALEKSSSTNFMTFHAAHEMSLGYSLFGPLIQPTFEKIHGLIAVSPVARDSIAKYFPSEYRIIPNGVDIEQFSPENEPLEKYSDGKPTILFVGRFEPRKGLRFLLQAFPYVKRRIPEARLVIVGKGALKTYYKYFADSNLKDSIHFEGYISPKELPRYYASCTLFCSPATGQESFGIVLLEAMASGKPVVASDIPGYRCVMNHGEEGLVVNPGNPKRLAGAIVKVLKDEGLQKRMGEKGRRKAHMYSWESVTQQVEDYYKEVLERRPEEKREIKKRAWFSGRKGLK